MRRSRQGADESRHLLNCSMPIPEVTFSTYQSTTLPPSHHAWIKDHCSLLYYQSQNHHSRRDVAAPQLAVVGKILLAEAPQFETFYTSPFKELLEIRNLETNLKPQEKVCHS